MLRLTCALHLALFAWGGLAFATNSQADSSIQPSADVTATLAAVAARAGRWSQDPRWLALEAGNLNESVYTLPGQASPPAPGERLVAFVKAALQPLPDIDADDRAWCRQPTRWERLQALARAEGIALPAATSCTSLERFADPGVVTGMEVLFVAPTSARSSASFGHLLLRLRQTPISDGSAAVGESTEGELSSAESDDIVYEISAITGFRHSDLAFLAGGLSGDYPLVFDPQSLRSVLAENLHSQQPNIQRFTLNLAVDQRRAILRLLWQVERELALPYRFTNRNCGTYLLWLLATALDGAPVIDARVALWAAPAEVIDTLRRVQMPQDGRPLLRHEAGSFQTSGELRDKALAVANSAVTVQERLEALVLAARADLDIAKAAEEKVRIERILPVPGHPLPDVAQLLQWRRQLYAREDRAWRRAVHVERLLWIDRYVDQAPRRPATAGELRTLQAAQAAEAAFVAATDAYLSFSESQAALKSTATEPPQDLQSRWRADRTAVERELWGGRVVRSPAGILGIRGEVDAHGWGTTLTSAFWREDLGQWRPHGVGPLRAFVLADIDTRLGFHSAHLGWVNPLMWLGNRARLFEYATVTPVPESWWLGWLRRLGWGLEVGSEVGPSFATTSVRIDGYGLLVDGVASPWLIGGRAGLMPAFRIRGDRGVQASVIAEAFAQRRVRATGLWKVALSATHSWLHLDGGETEVRAALALHAPWGDREAWWLQLRASADCDLAFHCRPTASVGVAF